MGFYRLYIMSPRDGRIVNYREIEANDDAEAENLALATINGSPGELWRGERRIRRFEAGSI